MKKGALKKNKKLSLQIEHKSMKIKLNKSEPLICFFQKKKVEMKNRRRKSVEDLELSFVRKMEESRGWKRRVERRPVRGVNVTQ